MKTITRLAALAFLAWTTSGNTQTLPPLKAADLNKRPISWPAGLPAAKTILLIAFQRGQQAQIDEWVRGLKLKSPGAPAWFEVPMIKDPGGIARWFIDNGMRSGIPNPADRAHVVTVYGNKQALMKSMGLPNETTVHALVVDRAGRVLERVSGPYSSAGAQRIEEALKR